MKLLLWIGSESNQFALANKLGVNHEIVGIVTESRISKNGIGLRFLVEKFLEKSLIPSLGNAWRDLLRYYSKGFPELPIRNVIDVENINSMEAFEFSKNLNPDLILVSGTRLIRKHMFEISPTIGILNLHTGLSPYIKGGPNCTNWCLATNQVHLIGNTVMWLDEGIDSGNLLTTEFTEFSGDESLLDIHIKIMDHAHDVYVKSVDYLHEGNSKSVPQSSISKGKTYYTNQWTLSMRFRVMRNYRNFKRSFKSGEVFRLRKLISVVKLD
mgnify:CR=1 FL=1